MSDDLDDLRTMIWMWRNQLRAPRKFLGMDSLDWKVLGVIAALLGGVVMWFYLMLHWLMDYAAVVLRIT